MANTEKQKIKEITDKLEMGLGELKESGIDMAGWRGEAEISELRNVLEAIRESSLELIMQIDENQQEVELAKEQNPEQSQEQENNTQDNLYLDDTNMEPVDRLLLGAQDQYGIFQLKRTEEMRDFRFMSYDFLQQHGLEIDRENYELVYTAPLTEGVTLDGIYEKFNIDCPEDFTGHSLSVSDVIVLHQNRENTSHYVDSFGFAEVPEFHRYPTVEEQIAVEETVDMLDEYTEEQTADVHPEEVLRQEVESKRVGYYVIEDLATWANNIKERSALKRFDSIDDAMRQFQAYRGQEWEYGDDSARTTFGVSIGGIEFDLIHVRNDENYLVQDFTQITVTKDNDQFLDDLQILCNEIGFDKTRLHREMTPEEIKDFVKERFTHQLQAGGLEDISIYIGKFDTLYEQGKMENLMPTAGQRHIQEDIPFTEWENPYIGVNYKYADLADKELSVTEYLNLAGMPQTAVSVDGLMEMVNSQHTAFHFAMGDKAHCLQEKIPVVTVRDGKEAAFFEVPVGAIERARNTEFQGYEPEEMAVAIGDRFIGIQKVEDGFDYTIYDADYKELDGGVYDNPNITIQKALDEIVADLKEPAMNTETKQHTTLQGNVCADSPIISVDYEELSEKAEQVAQREITDRISRQAEDNRIVHDFRAKTRENFKNINGETPDDIENTVYAYVKSKIEEYDAGVSIVGVVVAGSRCRGLEQTGSDLDVIVEFAGNEREDDLFNLVHEDGLMIGGVKVDINPITEAKTGTLATYLPQMEEYLTEKLIKQQMEQEKAMKENVAIAEVQQKLPNAESKRTVVTLTVAECSEFHNMGEYYEGIQSVPDAITVWEQIPPERMHGIPGISIHIHTVGTPEHEDTQWDILSGNVIDLDNLSYVPDITDNLQAIKLIAELTQKIPDVKVYGSLEPWVEKHAEKIAAEIDQLAYDYDSYEYRDQVEDREAHIQSIAADIRNGEADYMEDFLNALIAEETREGIGDLFGKGMTTDDSEAIQTVRKAKELFDRLEEYKPLAKVEELEEQNYNMIDNVLNNEKIKKYRTQKEDRVSLKERLEEKSEHIKKDKEYERGKREMER